MKDKLLKLTEEKREIQQTIYHFGNKIDHNLMNKYTDRLLEINKELMKITKDNIIERKEIK